MQFKTVRVFYRFPLAEDQKEYHKDYTVADNEPFFENNAWKQWQRDQTIPHDLAAYRGAEVIKVSDAPFVQLPLGFCEIMYPGYFWNVNERQLYTLKSGVLKPLKRKSNFYTRFGMFDGYTVSHLGKVRYLKYEDLLKIKPTTPVVIPTAPVPKRIGSRWN